jgi:copper resistance protein B
MRRLFVTLTLFLFLCVPHNVRAQKWDAADSYFDPHAMEHARHDLMHHHGGQLNYLLIAERLEFASGEEGEGVLSEVQGWVGTDYNRFWIKSDTNYSLSESSFEHLEVQALYSKALSAFFDLQAGVRHGTKPGEDQTFGVVGFQGLAQYFFEIDVAYFLSDEGKSSFRGEFEYDLLLTQRLILQPRAEVNFAVQDDNDRGVESGLAQADVGIRLRYEIVREIAPYVGAEMKWNESKRENEFQLLAGIRLWY